MANNVFIEFTVKYTGYLAEYAGKTLFGSNSFGDFEKNPDSGICPDDTSVARKINDCEPFSDHISDDGLNSIRNAIVNGGQESTAQEVAETLMAAGANEVVNLKDGADSSCVRAIFYAALETITDVRIALIEALNSGFLE